MSQLKFSSLSKLSMIAINDYAQIANEHELESGQAEY